MQSARILKVMTDQLLVSKLSRPAQVLAVVALSLAAATSLAAQAAGSQPTKVLDATALHPPKGATVAIVEFSDLECPACAHANPVLKDAAAKYKIPWVRRDYLIPAHPWSKTAAVNARWFDTQGNGAGDAYRDAVFANQPSIYNVNVLARFTENFASSHKIALPFAIDPQSKLVAMVMADDDLGKKTGVQHTPTIFIVYKGSKGDQYLEVENADRDLYRTIDMALAEAKQAAPAVHTAAAPVHHTAKK
jgi:protein-disulfide isomerase